MIQESVDQQEKWTQNLPFEVIAIPQYNDTQLYNNIENSSTTPIKIKIKIRNKEEVGKKHGVISVPKLTAYSSEKKVRLISSDQTIMSFDFYMEADTNKKVQKKSRKNIFHMFRPGGCLNIQNDNDDKYPYLPSSLNDANKIKNTSSIADIHSNIIPENLALKKNFPSITPLDTTSKTPRIFMGKCKPGGCLDPPFNEDKYSYKPTIKLSITSLKNNRPNISNENDNFIKKSSADTFKTENDLKINVIDNNENIIQSQMSNNLIEENYSHSLITYPLVPSSSKLKMRKQSNDSKLKTRISNEDKARISVNEFSDIYFMPPKKERIKRLENNHPEQVPKIEVKSENNKNNVYSLPQEQQRSHDEVLESHLLQASLNINSMNIDGSKLNIVKDKKISSSGEINKDSLVDDQSTVESEFVEIESNAEISAQKLISIDTDKNIVLSENSNEMNLMDKAEISSEESKKLFTENPEKYVNVKEDSYSSTSETSIPVKERKEFKFFIKESKESFNKVYEEMLYTKEIKSPSLNYKEMQKSYENVNINYTDIPKTEMKENFVKKSKESFKKEPEAIVDTDDIKPPSLKCKETQNIEESSTTNHTAIDAKEIKDIKELFKTPEESFLQHEEIIERDVIRPLPSKEERNIISKFDVSLTKRDKPSTYEKHLDDENYEIIEPSSSAPAFATLEDQETICSENALELDNISQSNQLLSTTKSIPHLKTIEKEQSTDISIRQIDDNTVINLSDDRVSNINVKLKTENGSLTKSVTAVLPMKIISQISEIKTSPISLTRSKSEEVILSARHEDRKDSTLGRFEFLSSSVSLDNGFDLTQKDIEDKTENDILKTIFVEKESDVEIRHSKQSVINKIVKSTDYQTSSKLKSSEILKVDINNLYPIFDTRNNDTITKKMEVTNSKDLSQKSISSIQSNNKRISKSESNILLEQSQEDRLNIKANSLITIDFGFRYSVDDENRLVIHTFDPSVSLNKNKDDKVCVIKSIIRVNDEEIRIPISFNTDLTLQIKKTGITCEGITLKEEYRSTNEFNKTSSERTVDKNLLLQETLNTVYENLIPLKIIINNLKEEAKMLSRQQTSFKEVLRTMEMKPIRLIHTKPQCTCKRKINHPVIRALCAPEERIN